MERYDIIVIGGGPAGLAAAIAVKKKGVQRVLIIERDSGILFDLTDADNQIHGLSGFILSGLMEAHQEKAYLVTTGYNRNMIRFSQN